MTVPMQTACAICGAAMPNGPQPAAECPTCGAAVGGAGAIGGDLFAKPLPKREPPKPPSYQERAIDVLKASGFWGLVGLLAGSIPLGIVGAMATGIALETSSRVMVAGGFGGTLGSLLGIMWGAVRVEELSTPKAIGYGMVVGVPLCVIYRFFLFPSDLMPESGIFDSIVMGVLGGVVSGAIVSWLNPD